MLGNFKEKNEESGRLWRLLSEEERQAYNNQAKADFDDADKQQPVNFKKERDKILKQLRILTDNTDSLPGFELLYIAVYGGTHAVGGSTIGRKFLLESDSHIPYSFVGYVGAKSEPSPQPNYADRDPSSLRKEVQELYNGLYRAFINNPSAKCKFPYKKVTEYGGIVMEGLPPGVELKQPGEYGVGTLVEILSNKHQLKLKATSDAPVSSAATVISTSPAVRPQPVNSGQGQLPPAASTSTVRPLLANSYQLPPVTTTSTVRSPLSNSDRGPLSPVILSSTVGSQHDNSGQGQLPLVTTASTARLHSGEGQLPPATTTSSVRPQPANSGQDHLPLVTTTSTVRSLLYNSGKGNLSPVTHTSTVGLQSANSVQGQLPLLTTTSTARLHSHQGQLSPAIATSTVRPQPANSSQFPAITTTSTVRSLPSKSCQGHLSPVIRTSTVRSQRASCGQGQLPLVTTASTARLHSGKGQLPPATTTSTVRSQLAYSSRLLPVTTTSTVRSLPANNDRFPLATTTSSVRPQPASCGQGQLPLITKTSSRTVRLLKGKECVGIARVMKAF